MATQKAEDDDMLKLSANVQCQKMLSKMGDNFPEQERVVLSVKLVKINKRGKEQNRILLLTDKALYNLKPKEIHKCQRRIDLEKVVSVTVSSTSLEFAIHIPEEYDYRYKSQHKDRIALVLAELYKRKEGKKLAISRIAQDSMLAVTVTKDVARLQTREQRLRRYQELIGKDNYDDEINDAAQAKVTITMKGEKVKPDDFEFLKVIGRGSFGKVMQVRKKDNGQIFAMKILKKKALIAKHQVEHSNAERKILQTLQHPFLMHLRYAFQTETKLYFVLDYHRGGELYFHLKKKRRFTEHEAQMFLAEASMALGHLHSLDIIYGDLKPENILLDDTGHICLTDFGLSKDLGPDNEDAHTFCGTPEYLAPEIVMNLGHGKAVDWWAVGILCYELTVGIPPFYSQNVNEMYGKIKEAPLLFPPNLSQNCKDLITKLLERDPKKRMGSSDLDVKEIERHSFFKNLDFNKLYKKEIEAPYKPNVKGLDDTSHFDEMFLKEGVFDTFVTPRTMNGNDGFSGFTYAPQTIGFSIGGAKDVNNFRECIKENKMPKSSSITYNGLLSEYYFDTKTKKHEQKVADENKNDSMLFYPTYCYAKQQSDYYLNIGLNSNIKQSDFKRKPLNLIIVLDKSGSMSYRFSSDSKTKMQVANESIVGLLKHLTDNDRFGLITFNHDAQTVHSLQSMKDYNIESLKESILSIQPRGSTNFESGFDGAIKQYSDVTMGNDEYENRIIFLTDARPNCGASDSNSLWGMVQKYAENAQQRIYTTFIGIGVDFDSSLIESISEARGCNYFSVSSTNEFIERMDEDFSYMVTPMVFNVLLKLKCEGNSCQIDKVYGSNDLRADEILQSGEIMRIHTLFPAKKRVQKNKVVGTKGGIQLIKLKKNGDDDEKANVNIEIEVSFEDRNGKKYKNEQIVMLEGGSENECVNDMIEDNESKSDDVNDFYDNTGIRKAILLCKYVDLIKEWIDNTPTGVIKMNAKYQKLFVEYLSYFKKEMKECDDDDDMQKEVDLMQKLIDLQVTEYDCMGAVENSVVSTEKFDGFENFTFVPKQQEWN